jgi:hypothetical protein
VERCTHAIITVWPDDPFDFAIPLQMSQSLKSFAENRFLILNLALVADVLPVAAPGRFVIWTVGLLPIGRGLQKLDQSRFCIVFLPFHDFGLDNITLCSSRHEEYTLLGSREPGATINQFFNFETHAPEGG